MSLIQVSSISPDGKGKALCVVCGQSVGVFALEELREMSKDGVVITCFNCDPFFADTVPPVLYLPEEQYLLSIDGKPFLADWKGDRHNMLPISWSAWMTLVSGVKPRDSLFLSSSTYLNAVCKFCGGREEVVQGSCIECDAKSRLSDD